MRGELLSNTDYKDNRGGFVSLTLRSRDTLRSFPLPALLECIHQSELSNSIIIQIYSHPNEVYVRI